MENYFCANSVEEQVDYLTDKVKDIITNKLDKASIVQETGTGTDVVMSQKAVTDAIANKGLDTLTDVNLTVGNTTVQYDTTNGIQLNSVARFTDAAGNHDATMDLDLPIQGKDGIVIDKAADSEKIEISGKNLIEDPLPGRNNTGAQVVPAKDHGSDTWATAFRRNSANLVVHANGSDFVGYGSQGEIYSKTTLNNDYSVVNKKYVDDNYVKKTSSTAGTLIYTNVNGTDSEIGLSAGNEVGKVAQYYDENQWPGDNSQGGLLVTATPTKPYHAANKKYVDDNFEPKRLPVGEPSNQGFLYSTDYDGKNFEWKRVNQYASYGSIPIRTNNLNFSVGDLTADSPSDLCANKKYVDDAIASISQTIQTKYQHNLVLEGMQLGSTFKAFMSIPRSDNTQITTLDELVSILGNAYISCTGYIYDGNQKSYNVIAFNTDGPGFEYNDPETGGLVFVIGNDVTISDDPIAF